MAEVLQFPGSSVKMILEKASEYSLDQIVVIGRHAGEPFIGIHSRDTLWLLGAIELCKAAILDQIEATDEAPAS